jgi:ketosteroid isomerase-like protein
MAERDVMAFVASWIDAWNHHDLERILSHYAHGIVFLSPIARQLTGNGRVAGIDALREYWGEGLRSFRDLKFELLQVLRGDDCLTILYRDQRGQSVAETVEFGDDGKVVRSYACYAS